jgi:hypothetical protein
MPTRSSFVRAISGKSASYGPPLSVPARKKSSRTTKRYAAVAYSDPVGGVNRRNPKRAHRGVAPRMNGRRRPRRDRVRSLQYPTSASSNDSTRRAAVRSAPTASGDRSRGRSASSGGA